MMMLDQRGFRTAAARPARLRQAIVQSGFKGGLERLLGGAAQHFAARPRMRELLFNAVRLNRPSVRSLQQQEDIRFLAYALAHSAHSAAQILQDLWVCYELDDMQNGFFVEFGATDGITNSNTAMLEARRGWRGLLAEPNPVWHTALRHNRVCAIDERCVAPRSGETVEFLAVDEPELGTIAAYATTDHFGQVRSSAPRILVETVSLNDLLLAHAAPNTIDYLSVDTEGSELDILRSFDFDRWRVKLLSVEHNNTDRERPLDELLMTHGFTRVFPEYSQWDGWYRHASLRT
jgi:FkbM family methyltransferase